MQPSGETHTELINAFLSMVKTSNPDAEAAVVLVGSVARRSATAQSDLDLLIVAEDKIAVRRTANRLHIQVMSEADFLERLKSADDFAAWCVRFGIPVVQTSIWDRIVATDDAKKWPDWRLKIEHSARRLLLANELLQIGDEEAALEELLYALSHVGRAVLLRANVFPFSRPEMISQLSETGYPQLGAVLRDFSFGRATTANMRRAIRYTKKLLVHLDRAKFQTYVRSHRNARTLKVRRCATSDASG
jgi:predicted nucleotidyltransferase